MLSHTNGKWNLLYSATSLKIMKVVLQYMDVHRLPVTHFTFINNGGLMEGMTFRQYFL